MGCVVRHGSKAQKEAVLPKIASGVLRMQSMAVTEPSTGSETTQLKTVAVRQDDHYVQYREWVRNPTLSARMHKGLPRFS